MEKTIYKIYQFGKIAVICSLCLSFSFQSSAQIDTSKKLKSVEIQQSQLPKVQTLVPAQSVGAGDFDRYNALNVADAIRDFSGVIIKDYGGIGGLKTISVRGLGANHTAIFYDGLQINDAENGQVDLSRLNLNGIAQINLYNAQPPQICQPARAYASASVLSISTTKPLLTPEKPYQFTAAVNAGSFGLINPSLQWQQRLSKNWSLVVNGYTEYANSEYPYLIDNGAIITKQTRYGSAINARQADGALYWANTDSNKFNFHVNYYNSDRGLPGPVILYTPPPIGQRLWNQDFFSQTGYEKIWQSGFHLLINAKFSNDFLHYFNPQFPNSAGFLDQHFTQREFYGSSALSYEVTKNWDLSYAVDFSLNNMDADLANFRFPTRYTLLNVFSSKLTVGKAVFQGSLLNTNVNDRVRTGTTLPAYNVWSPTLMVSIMPFADDHIQLRSFYKSIFRMPTFNELYYGFVTNTNLKPEYTDQYDLGATYSKSLKGFFDFISLTADAYYNHVTNKIVYIPNLYSGSAQNFGKVDIKGLDLGIKTQLCPGADYKINLSINYSYQQALNVTDPTSTEYLNQLPYIPQNTLALNTGLSKGAVGVYYNQIFSSSRYYNNNNLPDDLLPAYALSDITGVYKTTLAHFPAKLSVSVNNLFDKSYVIVQSYPMPRRSYRISFQITI